jgi:hypothetical protein
VSIQAHILHSYYALAINDDGPLRQSVDMGAKDHCPIPFFSGSINNRVGPRPPQKAWSKQARIAAIDDRSVVNCRGLQRIPPGERTVVAHRAGVDYDLLPIDPDIEM